MERGSPRSDCGRNFRCDPREKDRVESSEFECLAGMKVEAEEEAAVALGGEAGVGLDFAGLQGRAVAAEIGSTDMGG